MKAFNIAGWDEHYENNRSRDIKRPEWLPLPNKFDGTGFMELMDEPAGISHYGAWCLLLAAASRMPKRGLLISDSGKPLTTKDLARMTRGSITVFEAAIPRLIEIGWLEEIETQTITKSNGYHENNEAKSTPKPSPSATISQPPAEIPQPPAEISPLNRNRNMNKNKNPPATQVGVGVDENRSNQQKAFLALLSRFVVADGPVAVKKWWSLGGSNPLVRTFEDRCECVGHAITLARQNGNVVEYASHAMPFARSWQPKPKQKPQEGAA